MNYFVRKQTGEQYGPLSARQLRAAARTGALTPSDQVRSDGSIDWFRADGVRGLEFASPTQEASPSDNAVKVSPATAAEERKPEPASTRVDDPGAGVYLEPLVARGFNIRRLPDEDVQWVEEQGFWDAFRISGLGAFRGRRGVCILTTRRTIVTQATSSIKRIDVVHSERIEQMGIRWCVDWFWLCLGAVLLLGSLFSALLGVAVLQLARLLSEEALLLAARAAEEQGYTLEQQVQRTANLCFLTSSVLLALGVFIVLVLSRYRAIEFGVASGSVRFAKRKLEQELLSKAESARERCCASLERPSGGGAPSA